MVAKLRDLSVIICIAAVLGGATEYIPFVATIIIFSVSFGTFVVLDVIISRKYPDIKDEDK
jgi:hypothetical protein